jgi:dimethylargininase
VKSLTRYCAAWKRTALWLTAIPLSLFSRSSGGDVLKVSKTVYVGLSLRSTAEGVDELRRIVATEGYNVVGVPTTRVLHLKSCVTALPCGTVIGYEPLVDDVSVYPKFLATPEEGGAHVVVVGEKRLLMAASAPLTVELFRGMGYEVDVVDISEFEKLEGCVTCLSVRVR